MPFLGALIFYAAMSIFFAAILWAFPQRLLPALILTSFVMFSTALNIMLEFGGLILSPDDYNVIAPLPVSSRTFFYSKMINLLFYTCSMSLAIGVIPSVVFVIHHDNVISGVFLLAGVVMSGIATSFFVAGIYSSLLGFVSRERLSAVLQYAQTSLALLVYLAYFLAPKLFSEGIKQTQDPSDWWVYALPPAWYSSLIGIGGALKTDHWVYSSIAGLLALVFLVYFGSRHISIGYAAALARSESVESGKSAQKTHRAFRLGMIAKLLNPEEQAVFRLIWAQFRHDNKFKLTVLGIIPLTIMYVIMGMTENGGIVDPFVSSAAKATQGLLVFMALGMFPAMIQSSVTSSASYAASWIFFATPADLPRIIMSTRKFMQIYFVIPYLVFLWAIFGFIFNNFLHSLMLSAVLYNLEMILLSVFNVVQANVPFSQPLTKTRQGVSFWVAAVLGPGLIIVAPIAIMTKLVFPNTLAFVVVLAALVVVERLSNYLCGLRIRAKVVRLRYAE
jgi:hypothetical protein